MLFHNDGEQYIRYNQNAAHDTLHSWTAICALKEELEIESMAKRPPEDPMIAIAGHFERNIDNEPLVITQLLTLVSQFIDEDIEYGEFTCTEGGAAATDSIGCSRSTIASLVSTYVPHWPRRADVFEAGVRGRWEISYHRARRIDSLPMDARVGININYGMFWEEPGSRHDPVHFIKEVVHVLDRTGCCYHAFVDCGSVDSLRGGRYYSDCVAPHPLPFSLEVDHLRWLRQGDSRRRHVRGVYWGNYIAGSLAAIADPEGGLLKRFLDYRPPRVSSFSQQAMSFASGGMLLMLTDNPLDVYYERPERPHTAEVQNAAFLVDEFQRLGLL